MRSVPVSLAVVSILAACSQALYTVQTVATVNPPDAVFACVRATLDTMRYKSVVLDLEDRRTSGRKVRKDIHLIDANFYQAYDLIESRVTIESSGETKLNLIGRTMYEYRSNAGPSNSELQATDSVQASLVRLAQNCAPR